MEALIKSEMSAGLTDELEEILPSPQIRNIGRNSKTSICPVRMSCQSSNQSNA